METRYLPDADTSREEMVAMQRQVAEEADWAVDVEVDDVDIVAGVDQTFDGETVVSAAVAMEDGESMDSSTVRRDVEFPYVPGLLAFREAPAVVDSIGGLDVEPDVVLVDGSGRIHPRQAGLATHVGVVLDLPTVGVAKSLLCGEPENAVDSLREGARVPILAGEEVEASDDEVMGYAYQSKQYSMSASTSVNPLYVSPGHRVDAETAVEVVADCCDGYKLPEPVREADSLADRTKS